MKAFYKYIASKGTKSNTLVDYAISPASAFLKYAVDAKDASCMCLNKFKKKKNGEYHKDAFDSLRVINTGLLAAMMGNYETYQKYLFAEMFEYSIYLNKFSLSHFCKMLKHNSRDIDFGLVKVSAYRDNPMGIGLILAHLLDGWQNPSMVQRYFEAFALNGADGKLVSIYTKDIQNELAILWQMRHSIVHTAGVITIPDSQKLKELNTFGNQDILLEKEFITAVARRMHKIVKSSTERLGVAFIGNLKDDIDQSVRNRINTLFLVTSTFNSWFV